MPRKWLQLWRQRSAAVAGFARSLRAELRAFWREQRAMVSKALPTLTAWVRARDIVGLGTTYTTTWALIDASTTPRLEAALNAGHVRALVAGQAATVAQLELGTSVKLVNQRAAAWLGGQGLSRAKLIQGATRADLLAVLQKAVGEGWSPARTATAIRERFGAYSRSRATMVAQAELGQAYEAGRLIAAQEAAALGARYAKRWHHSGDKRVTPECRANAAAGPIALDSPFPSGHLHPLRHPRCRCTCTYEVAA